MGKRTKPVVDRRNFLKGAAMGAAALAAVPAAGIAGAAEPAEPKRILPPAMSPAAEAEVPAISGVLTADRTGSDFMVDVLKSIGFEYVCANPGSSFRGIHESIVNYGGNKKPEFITCCHEESSSPWRTATTRSRVSRWRCWRTAQWEYSMPRWRFTTPTATVCRFT